MIRFRCPKCGRDYLLANALARLPILCKGCGESIVVPEVSEALPEPITVPKPNFERSLPAPDLDILITPTVDDSSVNLFPSEEVRKKLVVPIEGSGPAPLPEPLPPISMPPVSNPESPPDRKRLAWLVDGVALVVALILGAFVGETLAGKSTLNIFGDSPASPKFPPTNLVMWVGSVAGFGLLYAWLITRGWSLGARWKR